MDALDLFVEKIVLHNKLASKEQLEKAKGYRAQNPGPGGLLDVLVQLGFIRKDYVDAVLQAYKKQGGAAQPHPPRSAATPAPSSVPASASPASAAAVNPGISAGRGSKMEQLLSSARQQGASDLHIIVGSPPLIRKDGVLSEFGSESLGAADAEAMLMSVLDAQKQEQLRQTKCLDTSLVLGADRFRVCMLRHKDGWDGSFRMIRDAVVSPTQLSLPEGVLSRLTDFHQGLILVTGPGGSGKSTTVVSMLQMLNEKRECHIITLEDPIEYIFKPFKAHFSQRQLGDHTRSFSAALRAALREDPDVIMIGELRDFETASLAVTAAETGHLVISTLHTTSAVRTITQLLDIFPANQKQQVRMMISESLRGVIAQRLVPLKSGAGRTLAVEVLINTPAIGSLIRKAQYIQIPSVLQTSAAQGMRLMDTSVAELVKSGQITGEEAFFAAENQAQYEKFAPADG